MYYIYEMTNRNFPIVFLHFADGANTHLQFYISLIIDSHFFNLVRFPSLRWRENPLPKSRRLALAKQVYYCRSRQTLKPGSLEPGFAFLDIKLGLPQFEATLITRFVG